MNNNSIPQLLKSDQKIKAITSFLLGIILLGSWAIAFIKSLGLDLIGVMIVSLGGSVISILGVIFGVQGLKSSKRNLAIIGIVLCLLVLFFSIYIFIGWLIVGGPLWIF